MYTFDIGITTFEKRFDNCFVPLLASIKKLNDESNIIVQCNGTLRSKFNEEYRKKMLQLSANYNRVFPFVWTEFRSIAKLVNNIVINSTTEHTLIISDDVVISDKKFFDDVQAGIDRGLQLFTINGAFAYFVISKTEIRKLGWFDERLLGVGNEDTDMYERHRTLGIQISDIPSEYISNTSSRLMDNYDSINIKYSRFNRRVFEMVHFMKQLEVCSEGCQYPFEEFYLANRHLL